MTGVQTCALPISWLPAPKRCSRAPACERSPRPERWPPCGAPVPISWLAARGVGASDLIDRLMLSGEAAKGGATGEGRRSGHQAMHVLDGSCRWIIFSGACCKPAMIWAIWAIAGWLGGKYIMGCLYFWAEMVNQARCAASVSVFHLKNKYIYYIYLFFLQK